ncbi:MAG: hypothetical protein V4712_12410 [Pseudomonadota bacterium]
MIPTTQNEPHLDFDDEDDLDDDAPAEKIREPVKLTRYDKKRAKLVDAEAKRDALLTQGTLSQNQILLLRLLEDEVVLAKKKFAAETARGMTDEGRAHERIDEYRKTPEGRDALNATRRKKRAAPNADLSGLTEDEKAKHKRELANSRQRELNRRKKEARQYESAADADQRKESQRLRTAKSRAKKDAQPILVDGVVTPALEPVLDFELDACKVGLENCGNTIAQLDRLVAGLGDLSLLQGESLVAYRGAVQKRKSLLGQYESLLSQIASHYVIPTSVMAAGSDTSTVEVGEIGPAKQGDLPEWGRF